MSQNRIPTHTMLLIKMTPGAGGEAAALADGRPMQVLGAASRPGAAPLLVIRDAARQDSIGPLDLVTADGRRRFVAGLPLEPRVAEGLCDVLGRAGDRSRDELAQLARVLVRAQAGELRLDRLVLSGHWDPRGIRGELEGPQRNGTLDFRDLRRLLALFPAAAAQVRHLMLATCFRGGSTNPAAVDGSDVLRSYRELFPRLLTLTGYADRAHLSGQGAEADLRRWARATAGADARPTRAQVFGACRRAGAQRAAGDIFLHRPAPLVGAAQRRERGVVNDAGGTQRCR